MVSTLRVFGRSGVATEKMSCDSTARSANLPFVSVPFSRSANSANADPEV